ncbi:MAG: 4'-phosphopantetheinyl transferase superfamily protein [Lachnospiraceae bacterium]|nr:4'-phosphopantetheinyl transferase superfamily protein [Lachnospiraceae bacterium]
MRNTILYLCQDAGAGGREALFSRLLALYIRAEGEDAPAALAGAPLLKEEGGKPYFPEEAQTGLSISHSDGAYAVLFSPGAVGVDIQDKSDPLKTEENVLRIANRVFHPTDCLWLREGDVRTRFFLLWTAYEAAAKYTGKGIFAEEKPIVRPAREEFLPILYLGEEGMPISLERHCCTWMRDGLSFTTIWPQENFVCTCVTDVPLDAVVLSGPLGNRK